MISIATGVAIAKPVVEWQQNDQACATGVTGREPVFRVFHTLGIIVYVSYRLRFATPVATEIAARLRGLWGLRKDCGSNNRRSALAVSKIGRTKYLCTDAIELLRNT